MKGHTPHNPWQPERSKRDAILSSAYKTFAEYGYANTKIETIAERAGVGKGTVYLYFASKEDLFRQMVKELVERHLGALRDRLFGKGSPRERLRALFETHMMLLADRPYPFYLHGRDVGFVDETLRTWMREQKRLFVADLEKVVQEGIRSGVFRRVDARSAAVWLFTLLGVALLEDVLQDTNVESRLTALVDLVGRGLWSQPGDQEPV